MSKVKYYYDAQTLSYRKIKPKRGRRIGLTLLSLFGVFFSAFLLLLAYINIPNFETPKERELRREIAQMEVQYNLLTKKMTEAEHVLNQLAHRDNNLYRTYFETNPIPEEQRKAGFGGVNRYRNLEGFDHSDLLKSTSEKLDILSKQIVVQSKSLDEIIQMAMNKEKLLEAIPAIQPVKNEDLIRMASGFGYRSDPFTKVTKFHYGMDFTAPTGTPIYASGNGIVLKADNSAAGYGNHIRIDHGYGYVSLYAHLYKFNVSVGQLVRRGELIGFVGSTGRSTGPHLHYEIFKDGERINPMNFYYGNITSEEFARILELSQQENQSLD
jgi:murein DD-endopeptidase MepM/ murein hydrolase activator NlpD